jgi:hypothetical protein
MVKHMALWNGRLSTVARIFLLGVLLVGLTGCQPPAVVDEPASNLDVILGVLDIDETPSDGKVIVVMQLLQNGRVVQISSNANTSCNGVALSYNGLLFGYAERVPIVAVGGAYTFRHSRNGVNTDVSVTVPPRPIFSPPTVAGATLARTNAFTIHYVAGTGASVRGSASDGTKSQNNSQPDDGTHDGLDVSSFAAGPGTLSITRSLESSIGGTGFHSATMKFDTNKTIAITWQ